MGRKEKVAPKTCQVRISTNALQNIDEITGYITFINYQPLNALKVGDAIFSTTDRIALDPFAFKECAEILTKTARLSFSILLQDKNVDDATVAYLMGYTTTDQVRKTYKRHRPKDLDWILVRFIGNYHVLMDNKRSHLFLL